MEHTDTLCAQIGEFWSLKNVKAAAVVMICGLLNGIKKLYCFQ
jgi:hypothetical protein